MGKRQSFMAHETLERSFRNLNEAGALDTSPRRTNETSSGRKAIRRTSSNPENNNTGRSKNSNLRRAASSGAETSSFANDVDSRAMTMPSSKYSSTKNTSKHRRRQTAAADFNTVDSTPRR